jgi:hypothetical protein
MPVTDRVDQYRQLLRYVVRVRDGVNVNIVSSRSVLLRPTSTVTAAGSTRTGWRR